MTPNQLSPQSMACKGNYRGVANMHHVHTDGDTVLREKDHAHPFSPRDTDLAHFISSVKFNASSDSPAGVVRMTQ